MPFTLHIHVPLPFYCSLHEGPTLLLTSIKSINATFIYHTATKLCQQQICPSNPIIMSHAQITQSAFMGEVGQKHVTYEAAPLNGVARIAITR